MSLPIIMPKALIASMDRKGLWPTAMKFRQEDGQLVCTVEEWGRKPGREAPAEQPTSRRGAFAQGALDL